MPVKAWSIFSWWPASAIASMDSAMETSDSIRRVSSCNAWVMCCRLRRGAKKAGPALVFQWIEFDRDDVLGLQLAQGFELVAGLQQAGLPFSLGIEAFVGEFHRVHPGLLSSGTAPIADESAPIG
ncbi:hypothetical protein ACFS3C_07790 [Azotobacter vinelandii]